jgi:prolyl-tRNA synthetase
MASIHVVIVPIIPNKEERQKIIQKSQEIREKVLSEMRTLSFDEGTPIVSIFDPINTVIHIDERDIRHGEKYFEWEKKGVPLRIEIGPKDIENESVVLVRRDTGEKQVVKINDVWFKVRETLAAIQQNLFDRASVLRNQNTVNADSWDEFVAALEDRKFVMAHWDGTTETEKLIKEETGATIRCLPLEFSAEAGSCIKTGKPSTRRVIFAKAH